MSTRIQYLWTGDSLTLFLAGRRHFLIGERATTIGSLLSMRDTDGISDEDIAETVALFLDRFDLEDREKDR